MYQVYQHWDPLQVCIVGRTYPPEFYHWIKDANTRRKFELLAQETEEDYQNLSKLLSDRFGVQVLRPEIPTDTDSLFVDGRWVQPPTAPRDYFIMIQDKFWVPQVPNASHAWTVFYRQYRHSWWPDAVRPQDLYDALPEYADAVRKAFAQFCRVDQKHLDNKLLFYKDIFEHIRLQGNEIKYTDMDFINGCFVSRLGENLFFATQTYYDDKKALLDLVNQEFTHTTNRVVNSGGHGDSVYCPITPGLIISINDVLTYSDTFPGWEVVYLPPSNYEHMREFEASMKRNKGRWFMPGFENDNNLCHIMEHYFDAWVGQVSETVFDVNILIVDPHNIVVSAYNKIVEDACARYGVAMHVSPFRHKYFWDAGVHCITNDLSRLGAPGKFI